MLALKHKETCVSEYAPCKNSLYVTAHAKMSHLSVKTYSCFITYSNRGKGSFYIAQYPVRWTAQSALHFLPSLTDLFIPTPTRLLREAF